MKNMFLLLILLPLVKPLNAQQDLRIVKDNLACAYGIMDANNKWVVDPIYIQINPSGYGYFVIQGIEGWGLLDVNGKQVIAPSYSQIEKLGATGWNHVYDLKDMLRSVPYQRTDKFIVKKGKDVGLVNRKGKMIVSANYQWIAMDGQNNLMLYKKDDYRYISSTWADTSGNILLSDLPGYVKPFNGQPSTLIGENPTQKGVSGNAGFIDQQGTRKDVVAYREICDCGNGMYAVNTDDFKTGMIDAQGNILIPAKYHLVRPQYSSEYGPICLNYGSDKVVFLMHADRKMGLIRGDGKVLVEPQYESITEAMHYQQTPNHRWVVVADGRYGTLNQLAQTVIEPMYDTLIHAQTYIADHLSGVKHLHLIFKQNGKYGLMTDMGTVIESGANDQYFRSFYDKTQMYYFTRGKKVLGYDLGNFPASAVPNEFVAQQDSILLFRNAETLVPFSVSKRDPDRISRLGFEHFSWETYGNLFVVQARSATFVFTKDGKISRSFVNIDPQQGKYLELITRTNKRALVDRKTGRYITDTLYSGYNQRYDAPGYIWALPHPKAGTVWKAAPINNNFNVQVRQQQNWQISGVANSGTNSKEPVYVTERWVLLDTNGKRLTSIDFDHPFFLTERTVAVSRGKAGVFDPKSLQWLIKPAYGYIEQAGFDHYLVMSKGGKAGLIGLDGKFIADTVYDEAREVYADYAWGSGYHHAQTGIMQWLMVKDGKKLLINNKGQQVSDPATIDALMMDYILRDNPKNKQNYAQALAPILMDDYTRASLFHSTLRKTVYSFIMDGYLKVQPCMFRNYVSNHGFTHTPTCFRNSSDRMELTHVDGQAFTICAIHNISRYSYEMPMGDEEVRQWETRVMMDGQLKLISLTDIFGTGSYYQEELIRAIQADTKLNLDCSTPEQLVKDAQQFTLSVYGVMVYLRQQSNHFGYIPIMIPWERLVNRTESAWLAKKYVH
jgi:hypothetical protein